MWDPWIRFAVAVAAALAVAVVVAVVTTLALRASARRREWPRLLAHRARLPFRLLVTLILVWIAVAIAFPEPDWLPTVHRVLTIAIIAASAWMLAALVRVTTDLALGRYRIDVPDNRVARRIRTQTLVVRRLAVAVIVIVAIGACLLTFPSVRTFGASLLASAGIASIVAGLAAQSVLANIFAGIQLVFSDAIRVDDVVVVEGEWGRIGEITFTYVVVEIWDDRRLVLPCTYFTTTPFQNWTRQGSELLGSVEFDLDWRVAPGLMRTELARVLADTDLWDGRAQVLQVTDAVGGMLRVRILVTAVDSPTLFDLRCHVRERMVDWIRENNPGALPVQRVLLTEAESAPARRPASESGGTGLFTGSAEAEQRARQFTQAIPVVTPEQQAARTADPGRQG